MLLDVPLPASLQVLLGVFQPCFTAPSFRTFCALACGFWVQTGRRTVCGMLTGASLSRVWLHHRAHYFARAWWLPGDLGLALADLVVALLVPAGEPVTVDDTLFRRRGKTVWAAGWFHDGSGAGKDTTGYGNNWSSPGLSSRCRYCPARCACRCLPAWSSRARIQSPGCGWPAAWPKTSPPPCPAAICITGDAAYAGKQLRELFATVTWTTRLRKDAAVHELPPPRTGRRGRPAVKGARLPALATLAQTAAFTTVTVTRYR